MCPSSYEPTPCNRIPFQSESGCDRGSVDIHLFDDLPYCDRIDPTPPEIPPEIEPTPINVPVPVIPCTCFSIDYSMKMRYRHGSSRKFGAAARFGANGDCCKGRYVSDISLDIPCPVFGSSSRKIGVSIGYGDTRKSFSETYIDVDEKKCRIEPRNVSARLEIPCPVSEKEGQLTVGVKYGKGPSKASAAVIAANRKDCVIEPLSPEISLDIPCPIVGREGRYSVGVRKGWTGNTSVVDIPIAAANAQACVLEPIGGVADLSIPCPVKKGSGKLRIGLQYGVGNASASASLIDADPSGCAIRANDVRMNLSVPCAVTISEESSSDDPMETATVVAGVSIRLVPRSLIGLDDGIFVDGGALVAKKTKKGWSVCLPDSLGGKQIAKCDASGRKNGDSIAVSVPGIGLMNITSYVDGVSKGTGTFGLPSQLVIVPIRRIALLPSGIYLKGTDPDTGKTVYASGGKVVFEDQTPQSSGNKKPPKTLSAVLLGKDGKKKNKLADFTLEKEGCPGFQRDRWRPVKGSGRFFREACGSSSGSSPSYEEIRDLDYVPDLVMVGRSGNDRAAAGGNNTIGVAYGSGPGGIQAAFAMKGKNACEIKMLSPSGIMNIPCPIRVKKAECSSYYSSTSWSACDENARMLTKGKLTIKASIRYYEDESSASGSSSDPNCSCCSCCCGERAAPSGSSISVSWGSVGPNCDMVLKDVVRMNLRLHWPIKVIKDGASSGSDSPAVLTRGPLKFRNGNNIVTFGELVPKAGLVLNEVTDLSGLFGKMPFQIRYNVDQWEIYLPDGCVSVGSPVDRVLNVPGKSRPGHQNDEDRWYVIKIDEDEGQADSKTDGDYQVVSRTWKVKLRAKAGIAVAGIDSLSPSKGGMALYAEARRVTDDSSATWGDAFSQTVGHVEVGTRRKTASIRSAKAAARAGGTEEPEEFRAIRQGFMVPISIGEIVSFPGFDLKWYFSIGSDGVLELSGVYCVNIQASVAGIDVSGPGMVDVTDASTIYARISTNPLNTDNSGEIMVVTDPSDMHNDDYYSWLHLYDMNDNKVVYDWRPQSLTNILVYR